MSLAVTNSGAVISVEDTRDPGIVLRELNRAAVLATLPDAGEAALSPDGTMVALALRKPAGEVAFYRVEGGAHLGSITLTLPKKQHVTRGRLWETPSSIRDLIYSHDGKRLAVVLSDGGPLYVVDAESRKLLRAVNQKGRLVALDGKGARGLLVDSKYQMFLHDEATAISVVDLNQGTLVRRIELKKDPPPAGDPNAATIAPLSRASFTLTTDGKTILATEHGELFTIDVASGKRDKLVEGSRSEGLFGLGSFMSSSDLLVSPDGNRVVWSHGSGNVMTRLADGSESPATENSPKAFSPDGSILLAASEHMAELHGASVDVPDGHETPVHGLAFLSQGKVLVSSGEDLRFWDGRSCQLLRTSTSQGKPTRIMASADGTKLLIQGRELRFVDVEGHVSTLDRKDKPNAVAMSRDGKRLAVGTHRYGEDSGLGVLEGKSTIASMKTDRRIEHLEFSPSGETLMVLVDRAWGEDKQKAAEPRLTLRRVDNLEVQSAIPTEVTDDASYAMFAGGEDQLLVGAVHRSMSLFDRKQGRVVRRFAFEGCCKTAAVSPDGALVAGSSESKIAVWELATRKFKGVLSGHVDDVTALSFTPDGKMLASGSEDTTILFWDVDKAALPSRNLKVVTIADASSVRSMTGRSMRTWYVTQTGKVTVHGVESSFKSPDIKGAKQVAEGGLFHCVLLDTGKVGCWGWTRAGALGIPEERQLNKTLSRDKPAEVPGASDAVWIGAGGYHACALTRGGGLWCWGTMSEALWSKQPELKAVEVRPHLVTGIGKVAMASVGATHTCAVDTQGKAWCWGGGASGQLGDGTRNPSATPMAVAGVTDVVSLAAGAEHTCAVLKNGAVLCWGNNSSDQLGNSTGVDSAVPVRVTGIDDAVEVASGERLTCARRRDDSVACWGRSYSSALSFPDPAPVPELAGAKSLQVMQYLVCGDINGAVRCVQ